jgi:hypothetical protein
MYAPLLFTNGSPLPVTQIHFHTHFSCKTSIYNCSQDIEFASVEEQAPSNALNAPGVVTQPDIIIPQPNTDVTDIEDEEVEPMPPLICNPLDPTHICEEGSGAGLLGNLFYLLQDQKNEFSGSLHNARIADYQDYGHQKLK